MITRFGKHVRRSTGILTLAAFTLAACVPMDVETASRPGSSNVTVAFRDNCAYLRKPFIDIRAQRDKIIGQNVATGALLGAAAAILAGQDPDVVLGSAIVGGLIGAAAAYAENAQSRGATQASLRSFVDRDARVEAAQNDRLVRTIVQMNSCRLKQADSVVARARAGEITTDQARALIRQIRAATKEDNRVIQRVAGNRRTYEAYVGVLKREDVEAALKTAQAVSAYQPTVRRVSRNPGGGAAIAVSPTPRAPTPVAQAELSRQLMQKAAEESRRSMDDELQRRLDELTQINEI